jgi:hypothetical protein
MGNLFEVAYNSDLIIRDTSEAATLCVFYDRVILPYTSRGSSRELVGKNGVRDELTNDIADWEVRYGTLFDAGVLSRLPAIDGLDEEKVVKRETTRSFVEFPSEVYNPGRMVHDGKALGKNVREKFKIRSSQGCFAFDRLGRNEEVIEEQNALVTAWDPKLGYKGSRQYRCRVLKVRRTELYRERHALDISVDTQISDLLSIHVDKYESGNAPLIRLDLARHLLRNDISIPQIFALANGRSSQDILVALEAAATFRYLLPKISTFHPTQILELRDKVKDTREGFTMHLWKLSRGLQEQANDGTSLSEIARFAESLIKTDLIPDYREFQRQLQSMRAEKWGKVLDAAGKVAEIDAAPWTPKFWALILKAIGMTALRSDSERANALSNRYQAFKFMSYVERSSLRI